MKAIDNTEKRLIDELVSSSLRTALSEWTLPMQATNLKTKAVKGAANPNSLQPRLETPEKVSF